MVNRIKLRTSVFVLTIVVILGLIGIGMYNSENEIYDTAWAPISSVSERNDVYSLTVNVHSGESLDELLRFAKLCGESNIPICFFFSKSFYSLNGESAKQIAKLHEVGLLIEEDTEYMSRTEMLRYLAKANESFYEHVGKYPRYVRSTKKAYGFLPHVLDAYGQYGIASLDASAPVTNGSIVDLGRMDGTTSSRVIALVTEAAKNGLEARSLRDILYSVDIKPDAFGVQHGNN